MCHGQKTNIFSRGGVGLEIKYGHKNILKVGLPRIDNMMFSCAWSREKNGNLGVDAM